jgi:probable rRNA maturation factor
VTIDFIYDEERFNVLNENKIKRWIQDVCSHESKKVGEINYRIVSDETILFTNQQFLNHDFFTDIITFDYSLVNIINGDIFISFDTVQSNSQKFNVSFQNELHRVVIHGIMHLCGYDDTSEMEKTVMRDKENYYLSYLEKL